MAASLACRISLGLAAALVAACAVVAAAWSSEQRWRALLLNGLCVGILPVFTGAGLLLYNRLRFGSWLEFGMSEQVSYAEFKLSPRFFITNLYSYALSPFELSCQFPFAIQSWARGPKGVPSWVPKPSDYLVMEPIAGFLYTAPITWLSAVPLFVTARHVRQLGHNAWRSYTFLTLCFAVMGSLTGALVLFVYGATMRYLDDFIYGIALLSVLGAFTWYASRGTRRGRTLVGIAIATLCSLTMTLGILLGYQGYIDHFPYFNPELDRKLVKHLSVCPRKRA